MEERKQARGQVRGAGTGGLSLQYRAAGLLFFLLIAGAGIVACSTGSSSNSPLPAAAENPDAKGSTPISHVVVIVQENRSFDDFFATFPNANGTLVGKAMPMKASVQSFCYQNGQPVITEPTTVPLTKVTLLGKGFPTTPPTGQPFNWNQDLAHNYQAGYLTDCDSAATQPNASNPCAMDGFDNSYTGADGEGHPTCTYTYQYVDPNQIQPYWDMAQQYVLADNTFSTQGSESFTAHQDLIAGGTSINSTESVIDDPTFWPWGCDAPSGVYTHELSIYGVYGKGPYPCFTYQTIRDLLDAKRVSWKYYTVKVNGGSAGIWDAFDAISAVRTSKEWGSKVAWPNTKIFTDIKNGHLPAVSWITPDGQDSDHPQEVCKCDKGPSWVASIVNSIGQSKYWKSSAIVVIWDDTGGFYDHVPPPLYDDQGGLGFRLPMIIISPYVNAHVEHTQYETTSVLKFIETTWKLGNLGQEDKRATSIGNAFDFTQTPRPFQVIPSKYSRSYFVNQKPSDIPPDTN
jgi:phospholipase C